ncbi:MAG: C39 family peptidase [Acidobacteriia bacterium]|nr:C39 family peptidase [Terriglobia bacterium]
MQVRSLARIGGVLFVFVVSACASPVILTGVPAYNWYHGCTPTSVASIFAYWDLHGYSNLFDAAGSDLLLTSHVQDQISSPAHNATYDSNPDAAGPDPPDTSIADFLHTSEGDLGSGGTYVDSVAPGIAGYAAYRGYTFSVTEISAYDAAFQFVPAQYESLWTSVVAEIGNGRPLLFSVDCCSGDTRNVGDGEPDHSVAVVGFDVRDDGSRWYGMYTTWSESETVVWEPYHELSRGSAWGVYDAFVVDPVPEPAAGALAGGALLALLLFGRFIPAARSRTTSGRRG